MPCRKTKRKTSFHLCPQSQPQPHVSLAQVRHGDQSSSFSVDYRSESGTATEGVDFEAARGTIHFGPGQVMKTIKVTINHGDKDRDEQHF